MLRADGNNEPIGSLFLPRVLLCACSRYGSDPPHPLCGDTACVCGGRYRVPGEGREEPGPACVLSVWGGGEEERG